MDFRELITTTDNNNKNKNDN